MADSDYNWPKSHGMFPPAWGQKTQWNSVTWFLDVCSQTSSNCCTFLRWNSFDSLIKKKVCLTWGRCHSPAAWRRPGRTRESWRYQIHWGADRLADRRCPLRAPRCAIRTGWSGWPGRAPRSRRYRRTQCTSRSHRPTGPGRRTPLVWIFGASWSW